MQAVCLHGRWILRISVHLREDPDFRRSQWPTGYPTCLRVSSYLQSLLNHLLTIIAGRPLFAAQPLKDLKVTVVRLSRTASAEGTMEQTATRTSSSESTKRSTHSSAHTLALNQPIIR
jgi:hypothetical protein